MIAGLKLYPEMKDSDVDVGAKDLSPIPSSQMKETEGLPDAIVGSKVK